MSLEEVNAIVSDFYATLPVIPREAMEKIDAQVVVMRGMASTYEKLNSAISQPLAAKDPVVMYCCDELLDLNPMSLQIAQDKLAAIIEHMTTTRNVLMKAVCVQRYGRFTHVALGYSCGVLKLIYAICKQADGVDTTSVIQSAWA